MQESIISAILQRHLLVLFNLSNKWNHGFHAAFAKGIIYAPKRYKPGAVRALLPHVTAFKKRSG